MDSVIHNLDNETVSLEEREPKKSIKKAKRKRSTSGIRQGKEKQKADDGTAASTKQKAPEDECQTINITETTNLSSSSTGEQFYNNNILYDVLSEKKKEFLQSPEVIQFLRSHVKSS
ncbi:uncharacterized protein LOC126480763 [Schistocerca serialis cubense]|uniref:uncharacterized protein LOC126480763 n=1 Tax=Schistocerca serialis cubense TaxID=2023355 RepID=UPI00214E04CA|nr:uncharacterized protein LOC126480763 [Schistocerca serialis cubense]